MYQNSIHKQAVCILICSLQKRQRAFHTEFFATTGSQFFIHPKLERVLFEGS